MRPTSAQINLANIDHNVRLLKNLAAPAKLCVVVKADGYGHGAVPVARTAISAGADWLAVALVEEGTELRQSGITAPILLLSEPRPNEMLEVAAKQLRPTLYSPQGVAAAAAAASSQAEPVAVHLKVDTGMHRVGATPAQAIKLCQVLRDKPELRFEGIWTHCATADDMSDPFFETQLGRFEEVLFQLEATGMSPPIRHAANSAATLRSSRGRYDLVRVGLSVYGMSPMSEPSAPSDSARPASADSARSIASPASADLVPPVLDVPASPVSPGELPPSLPPESQQVLSQLRPAMQLRSEISFIKESPAGAGISYGQRYRLPKPAQIATVPIGYADGVRRDFGLRNGEVLCEGVRHPVVGTVTMDQLMIEVQPVIPNAGSSSAGYSSAGSSRAGSSLSGSPQVRPGSEVILIGNQGTEQITAEEIARTVDTIPYEITCDIGKRVRREYI